MGAITGLEPALKTQNDMCQPNMPKDEWPSEM